MTSNPEGAQPRLLKIDEVCALFGAVDRSTIYRWVRSQRVPSPLRVGPNTSRWVASEIDAALEALKAGRAAQ